VRFSFGQTLKRIKLKIKHNPPLAKLTGLRFGFSEDLDFWNQDVKSTLLVDPAGQKPNTLNPDLVK
jgi:hypothetical protein